MRIVAADLEPILDDDDGGEDVDVGADDGGSGRRRGAPRHRRRRRLTGAGPWALTVALAVTAVALAVDDAGQRRRLDETAGRAAAAAANASTAGAEAEADHDRRLAEAQRLLEIARGKDEERRQAIAAATSGLAANGRRDPITERRSSTPWCRAKDLRVTPVGFVSRTGRRCALADHPVLLRRIGDGAWQEVPVFPSTQRSYSDGPDWDGELDPRFTAVLALWPQAIDPAIGVCLTGPADIEGGLDLLGIRLQPDDDVLELPGRQLPPSPCRPAMGVWAYDSTDA